MRTKEALIELLIKEGFLKTPRIIEAFRAIDRADFVPEELRNEAYGNYPLPIGYGQTISQPLTVAFMLELLQPAAGEKILDVGSGSGLTTALLSYIVQPKGNVAAVEIIPELCAWGEKNVKKYNFVKKGVAKFICGDGKNIKDIQFDKILSSAAAQEDIPDWWGEQLAFGGRIVAPIGNSIWLFTKKSTKYLEEKEYKGFSFVPLK